ncbi:MAG: hypothetical protein IJ174_02410, partial [Clostridia bacterium]|nr:hypothetical protein [Clostridia bacterium]
MKKSKRILAGAALAMMIAAGGHAETWQWGELDPDHMFTVLYGPPSMFEDPEHDEVLPVPGFVDGLPSDFEGLYGPPPFDPAPVEWNNGSTFAEQGTKTDPDGVIVYQDDGQSQGLSGKKDYLSNPGFEKKDGAWRLFPLG